MSEKEILMEEEIENKRKLSQEAKDKMNEIIFLNFNISIILMLIMIAINIAFLNIMPNKFIMIIKSFSIFSILVTITMFESAYRKESISKMFYGIELLAFSIIIMYIPYVYMHMPEMTRKIFMLIPIYFAIYYVAKSIIINRKITKEYLDGLSDVKEIVKDDEEGYLDEDSTKIIKEINKIEEAKKAEKLAIKEAKKKQKQAMKQEIKKQKSKAQEAIVKKENVKKDVETKTAKNKSNIKETNKTTAKTEENKKTTKPVKKAVEEKSNVKTTKKIAKRKSKE